MTIYSSPQETTEDTRNPVERSLEELSSLPLMTVLKVEQVLREMKNDNFDRNNYPPEIVRYIEAMPDQVITHVQRMLEGEIPDVFSYSQLINYLQKAIDPD